MSGPLDIEIFSDIACPWCFIGKRRFRRAVEATRVDVRVRWRAFELQPGLPADGMDAAQFFARKFGSPDRIRAIFERVTGVGREDGIAFAFDRMKRAPSTRLAHRAIKLAAARGQDDAAVEACFRGHFEQGIDVGDRGALLALLSAHGVDTSGFEERLAAGEALDAVEADEALAAELGIDGVPFFIAGGRLAVGGAQPPELFQRFLAEARAAADASHG